MKLPRPRVSVLGLLLLVGAFALLAWLGKSWLFPKRLVGQRFALIGPIDIDDDGLDDRGRLRLMILGHGGSVDYDLPPTGPASGRLGPMTGYYVVAEGPGRRGPAPRAEVAAIAEARREGVRPIPVERLLARIAGRPETRAVRKARLAPPRVTSSADSGRIKGPAPPSP